MLAFFKSLEDDYSTYTNEELCEMVYKWDDWAFEYLYEIWKDKLYSYVWTFLNYNDEDALWVSSDVFVKLYKYIKQNKVTNFKSFLYKVARNESINLISSRKTENINEYESSLLENIVLENWILWEMDQTYKTELLMKFLNSLETKYREVLYLYYFEWKDYIQIAEILSSNKNSVWTMISRWKDKLKQLIQTAWYSNLFIE